MAAKTISNFTEHSFGDCSAVSGTISSIADGDTLDAKAQAGLGLLFNVIVNPTSAVVVTATQASFGATTVTFKVASGTPTITITLIGK